METNTLSSKSITSLFYSGVPAITGDANMDRFPFAIQNLADMCTDFVYVIDFLKRGFFYVVNRDFFFHGHSLDEVLTLGYDFFPKVIHPQDLALMADMHAAILRRACAMDNPDEIDYFSFTARIKTQTGYLMAYHKLKPVFVDGQVRFGICMMSNSVMNKSGNLRAYYRNSMEFDEYLKGEWKKDRIELLSVQEKKVLIFARQGKTNQQIAGMMEIEHQTVRNIENSIYAKLAGRSFDDTGNRLCRQSSFIIPD